MIRKPIQFLVRTVGGLWSFLMILLTLTSLALSVAMTLLPQVLGAASAIVESVTGRKTVVARARASEANLQQQLRVAKNDLNAERINGRRLSQQISKLTEEASSAPVLYRGSRVPIREAVHDTAERVSHRAGIAATRNVGSTFGEALPVIGVGVIVAATAWELHDACQMMKEMRELDAAFNPDDPMSEDEVCGLRPPTRAEIWQSVKDSPGAVWEGAKGLYGDLPDVSFTGSYEWTVAKISGLFSSDDDQTATKVQIEGEDAPSDWNPLNWGDGR